MLSREDVNAKTSNLANWLWNSASYKGHKARINDLAIIRDQALAYIDLKEFIEGLEPLDDYGQGDSSIGYSMGSRSTIEHIKAHIKEIS